MSKREDRAPPQNQNASGPPQNQDASGPPRSPPPSYSERQPPHNGQAPPPLYGGPIFVQHYVSYVEDVTWGPYPQHTQCIFCGNMVITRVQTAPSLCAHMMCCLMFVLGCWLCSCIPYCLGGFHHSIHVCPVCARVLGVCNANDMC